MKKFLIILILASFVGFKFMAAEAAETYDVIHREIAYYNSNAKESSWIAMAILYASEKYQVDPMLITAVMETESHFNFKVISHAGAIGLMQLMPETARMLGVNPYNPLENVIGGTIYLRNQLNKFSLTNAIAAYNAGPQAVINANGIPNYNETQQYVVKVINQYNSLLQRVSS